MSITNSGTNNALTFYPRAATKELVVQELKDELLIYNLKNNQAICLNQTAALVWQNCDGKSRISEIAQKLNKKLKGGAIHERLIMFAIMELNEKGLIENGEVISDRFEGLEGLSRREIVRKVGFASLVALPIVSSIMAPQAAAAQTPGAQTPGACLVDFETRGECAATNLLDCLRDCENGNYTVPPTRNCCNGNNPGTPSIGDCTSMVEGNYQCDCICSIRS